MRIRAQYSIELADSVRGSDPERGSAMLETALLCALFIAVVILSITDLGTFAGTAVCDAAVAMDPNSGGMGIWSRPC